MPSNNVSGNTNWSFITIGEATLASGAGVASNASVSLEILVVEAIAQAALSSGQAYTSSVAITPQAQQIAASVVATAPSLALYPNILYATATALANDPTLDLITTILQYIYAASDVSTTGWTTNLGGTTNLYAVLDEEELDDSDYITAVMSP